MNSLSLIKQKKDVMQSGGFNIDVLKKIIDTVQIANEPKAPFPQADKFERIINLCELLLQKEYLIKDEITQSYEFDARQTDYYFNAGKYLGLFDIQKIGIRDYCILTKLGKQILILDKIERQKEFVRLIISHAIFKKTLQLYLDNGGEPNKEAIVKIMKSENLYNISSDATYHRRASTVASWVNWIIRQIEEYH